MKKYIRLLIPVFVALGACEAPDGGLEPDKPGRTTLGVAPGGSNATLVSNDMPTILVPGERVSVQVTMQNSGATPLVNDWDSNYLYLQQTNPFGALSPRVSGTVPVGSNFDFRFPITAPSSGGPFNYAGRMYSIVPGFAGFFGDTVTVSNITLDSNRRRFWGCALDSHTIPTPMSPDQVANVSVTVINTGTEDWIANNFCLYSRNSPLTQFGSSTCVLNNATVPGSVQGTPLGTGLTHTFSLSIRAPTTEGAYTFSRQMLDLRLSTQGGVAFFDLTNNCVDIPVTVGPPPFNSTWDQANSTVPTAMVPGEAQEITIRMVNSGSATWKSASPGNVLLATQNSPGFFWEPLQYHATPADTTAGNSADYTFTITAPTTPGDYNFLYRLFYNVPSEGFFGEQVSQVINVDPANLPAYDAVIVSEDYDTLQTVRAGDFRITVKNAGSTTWPVGTVRLVSQNAPPSLYGVAFVDLPAPVTPGNNVLFDFQVQGPATAGSYPSRWQMEHTSSGVFGAITTGTVTVIDTCGNSVLDPDEQCDDGNQVNNDGCSSGCEYERTDIDLAVTPITDRSFVGPMGSRNFEKVGIGDLDADGTPDVALGALGIPAPSRFLAGSIFVFTGGAGFFNSTTQSATVGAYLEIKGARVNDSLAGGLYGRLLVGEVTGDGIPDIIASAPLAACPSGSDSCGRIYVIRGGTGLRSVPGCKIDLNEPTTDVVATLTAPNVGDNATALAIGEVTGDGQNDILIGLPGALGSFGSVVVVEGGPALTSATLDAAGVFATINGAAADDQLGVRGYIGDASGDGQGDIFVSSARHDPAGGGSDAGALWAVFGPVTSGASIDLASTFSARWLGAGIRDHYGTSVATGDVTGNSENDVVVGTEGARFGGVRFGSVDVWTGPIASGTTFDLSATATPDLQIQGSDPGDGFGWDVHAAEFSNINVGNKRDIVATTYLPDGFGGGLTQAGEIVLLLGSSTAVSGQLDIPTDTVLSVYGGSFTNRMGFYPSSSAIGDIDNDGKIDICVGSQGANSGAGRVDCLRNRW